MAGRTLPVCGILWITTASSIATSLLDWPLPGEGRAIANREGGGVWGPLHPAAHLQQALIGREHERPAAQPINSRGSDRVCAIAGGRSSRRLSERAESPAWLGPSSHRRNGS